LPGFFRDTLHNDHELPPRPFLKLSSGQSGVIEIRFSE
jgi:hypothetical protein